MNSKTASRQAFTLVELLVIIAIIAVLAAIKLPALANTKGKVQRIYCSDNLKQVGLAFRAWAENHNDRMPMQQPAGNGGASSAVGVAANTYNDTAAFAANFPAAGPKGVFGMFVVMSNELNTPKVLYCPSEFDPNIRQAQIFGNKVGTGPAGFNSDSWSSYFVGVDANFTRPDMLLSGDHNVGQGNNATTKLATQFLSAGTNSNWIAANALGWRANQHNQQGNVLFADGSVQNLTSARFREALNRTRDSGRTSGVFATASGSLGTGVNRLHFPRLD